MFAYYTQIGKSVFFRVGLTLGTTSSIGASHTVSLPVTASSNYSTTTLSQFGTGTYYDASGGPAFYTLHCAFVSTTTIRLYAQSASGTWLNMSQMNATQPVAYATGDEFSVQGFYIAA